MSDAPPLSLALCAAMLCPPTGCRPARAPGGAVGVCWRNYRVILWRVLARWRAEYGDVVHLRVWPLHQVVISDPAFAARGAGQTARGADAGRAACRCLASCMAIACLLPKARPGATSGGRWRRVFPAGGAGCRAGDGRGRWASAGRLAQRPSCLARRPGLGHADAGGDGPFIVLTGVGEAAPTAAQAVRTVPGASHAELFWPASWPGCRTSAASARPGSGWMA